MLKQSDPVSIIKNYGGPPIRIMEICGTHTHEIFRLGIRNILPENIKLISGPGCPVCVTPTGFIDEALMLALDYGATICTFGDLVRVPGSEMNLADARAKGARVQVVYSPLDAADYAANHPGEKVVFLSVGFETTVPASCLAVKKAQKDGLKNFFLLTANKTMTNAYRLLGGSADAFLYPGHVSAITGTEVYDKLKEEGISGAVCGFTSGEILAAIAVIIKKLGEGEPFAVNCYPRVVTREGSPAAKKLISETMKDCDAVWRGLGVIKNSGLTLNGGYEDFDARLKFSLPKVKGKENPLCRCGDILRGSCRPYECSLFGKACTPGHPVGACMVSSEGTCSAYYKYGGSL
ncbi:hydrogenase expression/formation protein HypD [[Clostridium] cellulosi]|jgi:Hydrogenase formation hypA family.|uniref:Hydrogenase expression/formation protein HypD n=1 Tax=[Clostridium] cellulosi TaxID=29343 RepID=A0A078KQ71_9FIRM|nr:hydrogenase expression/formation protein HypD [[Clostridium] cellulosi]